MPYRRCAACFPGLSEHIPGPLEQARLPLVFPHTALRKEVPYYDKDRFFAPDEKTANLIEIRRIC
jgi:hypothetical protein